MELEKSAVAQVTEKLFSGNYEREHSIGERDFISRSKIPNESGLLEEVP